MRQTRTTTKMRTMRKMRKTRKWFSVILIFMLLTPTFAPYIINGQDVSKEVSPNLHIQVKEGATKEKAVATITSDQPVLNDIKIKLPNNATFNEKETKQLNDEKTQTADVTYDKQKCVVHFTWGKNVTNQEISIVLNNLQAENSLQAMGVVNGDIVAEVTETFTVKPPVDEGEKVSSVEKENDNQQAVEEEKKTEETPQPESKKETDSVQNKQVTEDEEAVEKEAEKKESTTDKKITDDSKATSEARNKISSIGGDLNTDIDISPYHANVEAGNAAMYKLVLKTTGSQKLYDNSRIIVNLPVSNYTEFTQDVSELKIAGVQPVYNDTNHTLVYNFGDKLRAGETYEKIVKVNTKNGIAPHDAELTATATLETDEETFSDSTKVNIIASNAISVSKKFKEARYNGSVHKAPFPGSFTVWDIKVSIPKKDVGQMFIKPGSTIIIQDTFDAGLSYYDVMNNTPQPSVSGRTLTWKLDAPTLQEQMQAEGDLFTMELRVRLQVKNDGNLIGTTQDNVAFVDATFMDNKGLQPKPRASASIPVISREQATGDVEGRIMYPIHLSPADGKGEKVASNSQKDENPLVYDDAYLRFQHGLTAMDPGRKYDMKEYDSLYNIDDNLILDKVVTPGNWLFARTNPEADLKIPLNREPIFDIVGIVNDEERTLVSNAKGAHTYTRSDLNLSETDYISRIIYRFTDAPAGMFPLQRPNYYFYVKPGYTGTVENKFDVRIKPGQEAINDGIRVDRYGNWWYSLHKRYTWDSVASERHATVVSKPTNQPPIAQVGIELLDHDRGEVVTGKNRMKVTLSNNSSSTLTMSEPLKSTVLLPAGVTLNANPNPHYTDNNNQASQGQYEVLNDDYNGSGRQLIKISWNEDRIRIGSDVTAELDVTISDGAPTTLNFGVYGFSGDPQLRVPASSENSITDTILQTDTDDLNGDGVTDEPRLKSGNIYTLRGAYDLETKKFVKGELDTDWGILGQTTPGGDIAYRLNLTNTIGKDISAMTLIDVLPSVGDLGITDNVTRGSKFTPIMTGPITLPAAWKGKVDVFYSTSKNPKRDDLTRNTEYPETTTPLSNPAGAEDPNWMTEGEVGDWKNIHSFKIELLDGETWIQDVDIDLTFNMQAPEADDVERSLLDKDVDPKERAAWNSFAVATDHGQPVEPERVGVYMNYEIEEPTVEKTVNEQKDPYELLNRDVVFTWEVAYAFGNYTGDWETVTLSDDINDVLEIGDVKVIDQNGSDVTASGEVTIENNVVTFDINKKDGSFSYLKNQTYTLLIESKIKDSVKEEELLPYIKGGGIPNQAELVINDDPMPSNEVKVKPPDPKGSLEVTKVDKELDAEGNKVVLAGAEFKLRDENGEVVATKTTDENGKLTFDQVLLGNYQLVETKAPEGYRLLKKPLDVAITLDHLEVQLEVENSKSGWELPDTGGIGTMVFYGAGAILMITALSILLRKKKTKTDPTKEG
ncbi:adhesive domain-containing protein [Virgibacillus sp.]|uniref:adhesive domain-containing protein n=1 Tax=Virgibacillus sp. TaxID=1872700 RepID=UPI001799D8E6|nr:adhesive domain-containing protein [Virgibacillus sp.]NWO15098.1 isopeptide-forming domain-containing fimbrial protein [Virgibacillus sp.]